VGAISVAVGTPVTRDSAASCIAFPAAVASPEERATIIRLLGEGAAEIATLTKDTLSIPVKLPAEKGT
jgi:hypothetical protein